jgi:DNA-binding response OmpR family regulator
VSERGTILVVDDEPSVCLALKGVLERHGYRVSIASSGSEALRFLTDQPTDLALLDLKMEGMDGLQLMAEIKEQWPDTVVMILTGYGNLQSALNALRWGAHDYLLKPSSPEDIIASVERGLRGKREEERRRQLLLRIETDLAELTRGVPPPSLSPAAERSAPPEEETLIVEAGSLVIDLQRYTASFHGVPLTLTPIEFKTLACLARRQGEVVRCSTLVGEAQGYECSEHEARSIVKTHLSHLRRKMKAISPSVNHIVNVRGVGYMFVADEEV